MKKFTSIFLTVLLFTGLGAQTIPIWDKVELDFASSRDYGNVLYDVRSFYAVLTAPSGRVHEAHGFWDGGRSWRIRFMPDETGEWTWKSHCSDAENAGLHGKSGTFECVPNDNPLPIYRKGALTLDKGSYHFRYANGDPFFWLACTAWNGALKSTDEEWDHYLKQRARLGYNVIQLVATQWRGGSANSRGEVAFTGCGRIEINPEFFELLDQKMDKLNAEGHVAGLIMLWTLQRGAGRHLSPGYYLPDNEAILLGRYILARYQGHHLTWVLGGDGQYYGEMEDRWKYIGQEVFRDDPRGTVTLHPHGRSWIGGIYNDEEWFDYTGYQSTHGTSEGHVNFINHTVADGWKLIHPQPVINMEPCYEQIRLVITADDVRNACWWSVFAAPPSGVTYGHDGTWPWLREGEKHENHSYYPVDTWDKGIELPGSYQVSYLGKFFRERPFWMYYPAQELLVEQPGRQDYLKHVSVLKAIDNSQVLVYFPQQVGIEMTLPAGGSYTAQWFDPVTGEYGRESRERMAGRVDPEPPFEKDAVLILTRE